MLTLQDGFMDKSGELWSARDIANWLGISMAAAYALVSGSDFPLPVRGLSHSRRWSQTVVRAWVTTPRFHRTAVEDFHEVGKVRTEPEILRYDQSALVVRPGRRQNRRAT